ncbi:replication-relaxation family protein [Fictibacillus sp. Mic-4]|uniref:replication-relaxation family protein n=1 Tax=Fictibacillus sp. Mic-4 TaxID=3132826 RepID=UPI003CF9DC8B
MRQRDKAILDDLQRFRVMSRDDIIDLHFANLKQPVTACNTVLKRLRRDGYVEVDTQRIPYLYFPSPRPIKKGSAKTEHFLAIVEFYKELRKYAEPKQFIVEPKLGAKGTSEPDAFMIWQGAPFYIEIQRNVYSKKVMDAKIKRYRDYFDSELWKDASWQPKDKRYFPNVWIVSPYKYEIEPQPFRVLQSASVAELMQKVG